MAEMGNVVPPCIVVMKSKYASDLITLYLDSVSYFDFSLSMTLPLAMTAVRLVFGGLFVRRRKLCFVSLPQVVCP